MEMIDKIMETLDQNKIDYDFIEELEFPRKKMIFKDVIEVKPKTENAVLIKVDKCEDIDLYDTDGCWLESIVQPTERALMFWLGMQLERYTCDII